MWIKRQIGLLVFLLGAGPLWAQETKTFFQDQCSFTLPDEDWAWMQPEIAPNVTFLAQAKNSVGTGFQLACEPIKGKEDPTPASYVKFEATFLKASKLNKLTGKEMAFNGLPAYQIQADGNGLRCISRLVYANDRLYVLSVIDASGTVKGPDDAEYIFAGFEFSKQPQPVFRTDDEKGAEREQREGSAMIMLAIGAIVIVGAVGVMIQRKISRGT